MENNQLIYFNFFSICALIPTIFGIILSYFLISIKNKSTATSILGLNLLFLSIFYLAYFVSTTFYHPLSAYHRIFTISGSLLCMSFFTIFFFYFPDGHKTRFAKYLIFFLLSVIVILITVFTYNATVNSEIVFNFNHHAYDFSSSMIEKITPLIILTYLTLIIISGIYRAIKQPSGKRKEILIIAITAFLTLLIPSITNLLSRYGIVSRNLYQITQDLSTISGYYIIVIIYLNSGTEHTTFITRIIAVTFATFLIAFQLLSYFTLKEQESTFFKIKQTQSSAQINSPDLIARTGYSPKNEFSHSINAVFFEETPHFKTYLESKLTNRSYIDTLIRKSKPDSFSNKYNNYLIFYSKYEEKIIASIYNYRSLREFIDPQSKTFIIIIFLTIGSVLFGYKFIFLYSITNPLNNLQNGIDNVNEGNYNVNIPIAVEDEIGYITKNFNHMVNIIHSSEKKLSDYAENLENKVRERTIELEQSLNDLETAQNQLIEQEKMAFLGGLVAGVAHEINTPLGICVTAASHLKKNTNSALKDFNDNTITRSFFEQYLKNTLDSSDIILKNLENADLLINSFKKVAVDQSDESHREFNVPEYINDIIHSLKPQLKENNVNISFEFAKDNNITIFNYPGALYQSLTNLIMNSIIHAFNNESENPLIVISCQKMDQEIEIIYSDNGKGMNQDTLSKIFHPFFTTRRGNGGSGLGMNIVYNQITRKMQGTIEARSNPGEGTVFKILIPPLKIS